jgi:hypothetical protein
MSILESLNPFKKVRVNMPVIEPLSQDEEKLVNDILEAVISSLKKDYAGAMEQKLAPSSTTGNESMHITVLRNLLKTDIKNIGTGGKTKDQIISDKKAWFLRKLGIDQTKEPGLGEIVLTGNAKLDLRAIARLELGSNNLEIDNIPTPLGEKVYKKLEELYLYYNNIKDQEGGTEKINKKVREYIEPFRKSIK